MDLHSVVLDFRFFVAAGCGGDGFVRFERERVV